MLSAAEVGNLNTASWLSKWLSAAAKAVLSILVNRLF
jgi:hypothetical protein